jgi:hypothetical protein
MESGTGDLPSQRWRLTAPESYTLQVPYMPSSVEAFKLALRELVLRRALRVEPLERVGFLARRRPPSAILRAGTQHVYPSLVAGGLFEVETRRGAFSRRPRYLRTAAGDEAAAELEEWLRIGRERISAWARAEPERAVGYLGAVGAAILLMRDLYPELNRIGKNVLTRGDVAFGGGAGAFDDFDGGAFDSFEGIDAGVDAGRGGGGNGG